MCAVLTPVSLPAASEGAQPVATVTPPVLTVQLGGQAVFRCTVTGNPTPAIEWIGKGFSTKHDAKKCLPTRVAPVLKSRPDK